MTRIDVTRIRREFADTVNRVVYRKERVILDRRGKDIAAIVPIEDLNTLRELETEMDVQALRKAKREWEKGGKKTVPWEKIVRSPVAVNDLETAYREMAKDEKSEAEAIEWCEALAPDARDETR